MSFFSIKDVGIVVRKNIRIIIFFGVILAVLLGGYKYISGNRAIKAAEDANSYVSNYEEELKQYNNEKGNMAFVEKQMKNNIDAAYLFASENPIMKLDPSSCEYERVTINYEDPEASREESIESVIAQMEMKALFGEEDEIADRYRSDIICVPGIILNVYYESKGQTILYVFDTEHSDSSAIAKRLIERIKSIDTIDGAKVSSINSVHLTGACQVLYNRQREIRLNAYYMQDELRKIKELDRLLEAPSSASTVPSKASIIKASIEYGFAGVILGLLVGLILVLYTASNSGVLISKKQMDELFEIDNIGMVDKDHIDNDVVITSIQALSSGYKKVMLLDVGASDLAEAITELLCSEESIEKKDKYVYGHDITDNKETIERIASVEGIILGIGKGSSTVYEIQKSISRLKNLKKDIIGYILFY